MPSNKQNDPKTWFNNKLRIGPMIHEQTVAPYVKPFDIIINVSDFSTLDYTRQINALNKLYFWFPINETQKEIGLNSIYAALHILYQAYHEDATVYLHCWAGRNRSKMVAACFFWMMTGEDLDSKTYGARNRQDDRLLLI